MCTVSLIRTSDGARLVSNRDELRTRARAVAPSEFVVSGMRVIAPIDPVGGGTWIGVNEAGLMVTLLNQTASRTAHTSKPTHIARMQERPQPHKSRGEVVLRALGCASLEGVRESMLELDASEYGPMLLIATNGRDVVEARSLAHKLDVQHSTLQNARIWSSSSLGDELVSEPRRALFDELVSNLPSTSAQDAFHAHIWPSRRWQSVMMSREDARTVSTCACELRSDALHMTYTDHWHREHEGSQTIAAPGPQALTLQRTLHTRLHDNHRGVSA